MIGAGSGEARGLRAARDRAESTWRWMTRNGKTQRASRIAMRRGKASAAKRFSSGLSVRHLRSDRIARFDEFRLDQVGEQDEQIAFRLLGGDLEFGENRGVKFRDGFRFLDLFPYKGTGFV